MPSFSKIPYGTRALSHANPVAKKLFNIALKKRSNLVFSADFTTTDQLLRCADEIGPYIAVLKTHIDMVSDFNDRTVQGLKALAAKHEFLIFEDRKFVDIGTTVRKQYHGGALRISDWADIVNVSILGGQGAVKALYELLSDDSFPYREKRALLLLGEMTTVGSLAVGKYTQSCIDFANRNGGGGSIIGLVANKYARDIEANTDLIIFTTGINSGQSGDYLGQQYRNPEAAIQGGSDFVIVGRGIYFSEDPVKAARQYQQQAWAAYEARVTTGLD